MAAEVQAPSASDLRRLVEERLAAIGEHELAAEGKRLNAVLLSWVVDGEPAGPVRKREYARLIDWLKRSKL